MQCISPAAAAAEDHFGAIIVNYGLHFGGSFIHSLGEQASERASRLLRRSENAPSPFPLPANNVARAQRVGDYRRHTCRRCSLGETVAAAVSGKYQPLYRISHFNFGVNS